MKLSVIIVSYNVKEYLMQCIRSVYKSDLDSNEFEIIVVDNDSHDGSIQEIQKKFNKVIIKANKKNYGFSKAINQAISISSGEYLSIINPDCIIREKTFSTLINFLEKNKNVGCVGPKILNVDGTIQHSCKRSFPTPLNALPRLLGLDKLFPKSKWFGKYNLTYIDDSKQQNVDSISGAFMLIPKLVVDKIGSFDENFFMFGEDIDYCYRIKENGYLVCYNPDTEIIHYKGESVKNAPYDMVNIFYSAMNIYFDKYSEKYKYWKFFKLFIHAGLLIRKFISYLKLILYKILHFAIDIFFILTAFSLSIYLWYTIKHSEIVTFSVIYSHLLLMLNFIFSWYIASSITKFYKHTFLSSTGIILTTLITFFISSTSTYFISFIAYSRGVLFLSTLITSIFLILWRVCAKILFLNQIINSKSFVKFSERRALIIGADKESFNVGNEIMSSPNTDISIIGYTDIENSLLIENFLGKIKYIKDIVLKNQITEVIVRESSFDSEFFFNIVKSLKNSNVSFKIIPNEGNIILSKGKIEEISGIDLLSYEIPFLDKTNIFIKRFFDIFLSLFLIILTIPFYLFSIFLNKVKTKKIWGLKDRQIRINYIDSNNRLIGSIPLLYKVFYGDISFVGSEFVDIINNNPNYISKPGLLSLLDTKKFKNYDCQRINNYYIKNQSLTFDIEIILKSLFRI